MNTNSFSDQYAAVFNYILNNIAPGCNTIALDGRCASGKSTLALLLSSRFSCNVFHMDDFFLHGEMRTPERLATPGENIDHERFLKEVLLPLFSRQPVLYRRYNCHLDVFEPPVHILPKPVNIIEGVYSFHPSLEKYYSMKIFMDIDPSLQKMRILHRNSPEQAERFFKEWIPLEEDYFRTQAVPQKADFIFKAIR